MHFTAPLLLVLAPLVAWGAWVLARYAARKRREALALFLGPRADAQIVAPLARRRRVRAALVALALGLGVVALAGPVWGTATREARSGRLDLVVALDVSNSMRTADVAPSRLDRARLDVRRLVDARAGDRIALVVFAGDAFVQCPLTTDRGAVRLFLDAATPDAVPVQGTSFAAALDAARLAFEQADGPRARALVVVSDGEDHEGGLDAAADRLRDEGVALFALGVGTDDGGPVPSDDGRGVRRDADGEPVTSRYEGGALEQIAGRDVVRAGRGAVDRLSDQLDGLDGTEQAGGPPVATGAERYQWPLALALLLLAAERWIATRPLGETRRRATSPATV